MNILNKNKVISTFVLILIVTHPVLEINKNEWLHKVRGCLIRNSNTYGFVVCSSFLHLDTMYVTTWMFLKVLICDGFCDLYQMNICIFKNKLGIWWNLFKFNVFHYIYIQVFKFTKCYKLQEFINCVQIVFLNKSKLPSKLILYIQG